NVAGPPEVAGKVRESAAVEAVSQAIVAMTVLIAEHFHAGRRRGGRCWRCRHRGTLARPAHVRLRRAAPEGAGCAGPPRRGRRPIVGRVTRRRAALHRARAEGGSGECRQQPALPDRHGYAAFFSAPSRSSRRRILPTLVLGSSLRNSMYFGRL